MNILFYTKAVIYILFIKIKQYFKARENVFKTKGLHDEHVQKIIKSVQSRGSKRLSLLRDNSETHCTRKQAYKNDKCLVDISNLNKILGINIADQYIELEPLCTMEKIHNTLKKHGHMLPVTPEFKGITIGGTIAGGGLESSSFRYGMVQSNIIEYDMILGNGEKMTLSKDRHPDLFYGSMWALGTTGIVTRIKIRIMPYKPYTKLTYRTYTDFALYHADLTEKCKTNPPDHMDFIEGVQVNKDTFMLIEGQMVDYKYNTPNYFCMKNWWSKWFIQHLFDISKYHHPIYEDTMSTDDYLFRWDRGIFWLGLMKINPTFIKRLLFGWMFDMETHHTVGRLKKDSTNEKQRILTDIGPPLSKLRDMTDFTDQHVGVYPMWHLPFKLFPNEHHIHSCEGVCKEDIIIDFGLYGVPMEADGITKRPFSVRGLNRDIEKKVHSLGGMKGFETVCYYTKEEYDTIFDVNKYHALREKYHADDAFPTLFEKIVSVG